MNQRKSAFAGMSPAAPHHHNPPTTPRRAEMQRFTLRLPKTLVEQVRTAWLVDGAPQGVRSVSAWVAQVLQSEIDRVEKTHGPLPGTPAGVVPSGWDAHQAPPVDPDVLGRK